MELNVNGKNYAIDDVDLYTPLLWVLRDILGFTGVKFGCGVSSCGACTVHINDEAIRSCTYPLISAKNKKITTIEGLGKDSLHPVQEAWIQEDVPQCGYCQSGQIMAVSAFLKKYPNPSDEDIKNHITNICRCGTYPAIKKAIKKASKAMSSNAENKGS